MPVATLRHAPPAAQRTRLADHSTTGTVDNTRNWKTFTQFSVLVKQERKLHNCISTMNRMTTRSLSASGSAAYGRNPSIGPTKWKTGSHTAVDESNSLVRQASRTIDIARRTDPLPGLRDVVAGLSNDEAHGHFRRTRPVVHRLRDVTIDTNAEIRSMNRLLEAIKRALASVQRDLQVNSESVGTRQQRPQREKVTDSADSLLSIERTQLMNAKKALGVEQGLCRQQLKVLDAARRRLSDVTRERARVLGLVCHDPSVGSARLTENDDVEIDPLGAYTPEVDEALREAHNAILASTDLRQSAERLLETVNELEQTVWNTVNAGLSRKVSETAKLKHQLETAAEENRLATIKVQKLFDHTDLSRKQFQGPMQVQNLELREKLDRPLIKMMQRHPGNQMPEAQHIVRGTESLTETLQHAGLTLGQLKLSQRRLQEDAASKRAAIKVDNSIVRMRRQKTGMYCA